MFNKIEELYQKPIIKDPLSNDFICPVCGKKAKQQKTIEEHMSKQDCFDIKELCMGTIYEQSALDFLNNNDYNLTIGNFRKTKIYRTVMRFVLYCFYIETTPQRLFEYLKSNRKNKSQFISLLLSYESLNVRAFRRWLQNNESEQIDSEDFYYKNLHNIKNDENFLKSALLKGKISVNFVEKTCPELLEQMSYGNYLVICDFFNGVD